MPAELCKNGSGAGLAVQFWNCCAKLQKEKLTTVKEKWTVCGTALKRTGAGAARTGRRIRYR